MEYYINPAAFSGVFTVPSSVVDKSLKLAKGEHIKVLLYLLRDMADKPSEEQIAAGTGVDVYDVREAMIYWAGQGILVEVDAPEKRTADEKPKAVKKQLKPGRADIARRGNEDPKIRYLLQETQLKFGRNLKTNETATLVWLYDDLGLDISLILMIVQFAIGQDKCNITFIEKIAAEWVNNGITNIGDAEARLAEMAQEQQAWRAVQKAFGIEKRQPSKNETALSVKWICEWKMSPQLLKSAYNVCIDSISKFSIKYIEKTLENWHIQGIKKPEDTAKANNKTGSKKNDGTSLDIDLFEKMLKSKY